MILGPVPLVADLDPTPFFSILQDANKVFFVCDLAKVHSNRRKVEIKVFFNFLLIDGRTQIHKNNSGSRRPTTPGSYDSGYGQSLQSL